MQALIDGFAGHANMIIVCVNVVLWHVNTNICTVQHVNIDH